MKGVLYVVSTPIGNLEDLTLRAIRVLKDVQMVACEDTRRTGQLLRHLQIQKPLYRYDDHTHTKGMRGILDRLDRGQSVALLTDAGTPGVSDPGSRLVDEILSQKGAVVSVPGPSAVTAALSISGFFGSEFLFLGFLSRRKGQAQRQLREALGLGKTIVLFESPYRVKTSLEWLAEMAPAARIAIIREISKIHEEIVRGNIKEVQDQIKARDLKGEFVLIIDRSRKKSERTDTEEILLQE